ncbi:hypothetical protein ACFOYW_02835 [Gryllotalpicola reticulitermitis]|uniref:Copper(I)-binding protein n=1 Tax=Gryllotalpicola reticulitermitis TaxID=1184153 RepID=A0ABV8Q4L0_9MICO
MKARVAASVVLAIGVAIGTAGCGFLAPQETTRISQPTAFGVQGDVGSIHIRNAYFVAQGNQVALIATFVNSGTSGQTVSIQPNASASDTQSLHVGQGDPTVIGPQQQLQWSDLSATPGSLLPVFFSYGSASGVTLKLPVLTGDFGINSTLTPTPAPTDSTGVAGSAAPTDSSTPSATPAG